MNPYNICVSPMFDPSRSQGGIWIPDQSKERCDQGVIKYLGSKVPREYLKEGMQVLFPGYSGTLLKLTDEGLVIILDYREIIAVISTPATEIPGLYFLGKDGQYYQCTYEQAVESIAAALSEDKVAARFVRYGWHGNLGKYFGGKKDDDNKLMTKNLSYEADLPKNGWAESKDD